MKGYRTLAVGLVMAVAVPGLTYLAGVDWTQYVSPNQALVISGGLMIVLRLVTNTAIGR